MHYLLFIISVKLAKDKVNTVCVITFVMTCVYMIAFRVLVKRTSWYASSLAFPTGVYIAYCYSEDQTRICKIFQEHQKHIVLVLLLFTFFFSGVFNRDDSRSTTDSIVLRIDISRSIRRCWDSFML